jgi:hypothetical protein
VCAACAYGAESLLAETTPRLFYLSIPRGTSGRGSAAFSSPPPIALAKSR